MVLYSRSTIATGSGDQEMRPAWCIMSTVLYVRSLLRCRTAILSVLIIAVVFSLTPSPLRAEDPDLAQIAKRLKQWRSSFANLRIAYDSWGTKWLKDQQAIRPSPADRFYHHEWVWADVGAIRSEEWSHKDGRITAREAAGADARTLRHFRAFYAAKNGTFDFPSRLELGRLATSQATSIKIVTPLTFIYAPMTGKWLGERLDRGYGKLEEYENVDGAKCARVNVQDGNLTSLLWLDSEHDFLVRRIRPDPDVPQGGFLFDVTEFQKNGAIWFPKRGVSNRHGDTSDDATHWYVVEVTTNMPLDGNLFDPPAPQVGTRIEDQNRRVYVFGEKRSGKIREGQITEPTAEGVSGPNSPIVAKPPIPIAIWWSGGLLTAAIALVLLATAIVVWRRGA